MSNTDITTIVENLDEATGSSLIWAIMNKFDWNGTWIDEENVTDQISDRIAANLTEEQLAELTRLVMQSKMLYKYAGDIMIASVQDLIVEAIEDTIDAGWLD